jgi:hypothetical protein
MAPSSGCDDFAAGALHGLPRDDFGAGSTTSSTATEAEGPFASPPREQTAASAARGGFWQTIFADRFPNYSCSGTWDRGSTSFALHPAAGDGSGLHESFEVFVALLPGHKFSDGNLTLRLVINMPGRPKLLPVPIAALDSCRMPYDTAQTGIAPRTVQSRFAVDRPRRRVFHGGHSISTMSNYSQV